MRAYRLLLEEAAVIYVFRNGTAVWSTGTMTESEAVDLLRTHGPVIVGTKSADYAIAALRSPLPGYVLKYHHPQLLSFAGDFPPGLPPVAIGSMIRLSRDMDSYDLHVVARYSRGN